MPDRKLIHSIITTPSLRRRRYPAYSPVRPVGRRYAVVEFGMERSERTDCVICHEEHGSEPCAATGTEGEMR